METKLKIIFPYFHEESKSACVALINEADGVECMFWHSDEIKEDSMIAFSILSCAKDCYEDPDTLFNLPHIQSHYQAAKKNGIIYLEYI